MLAKTSKGTKKKLRVCVAGAEAISEGDPLVLKAWDIVQDSLKDIKVR